MKETDYSDKLKAWMLRVITHPDGVYAGAGTRSAQQLLSDPIENIIKPSSRLSSEERLSIYQRAYYGRLLECFSAEYPALKQLLKEEIFRAFVVDYLQQYPSRTYTLNQLGAEFPTYLAKTQPERKPSDLEGASWIDFILELATLERAYTEMYDGPGHEKDQLPNADDILKYSFHSFGQLKLVPANCLRLFTFQFPVHEYLMAVRKGGSAPENIPQPQTTFVALTRSHFVLRFINLSQLDYQLFQLIFEGHSINKAVALLPSDANQTSEVSMMAIRSSICTLADEGFFQRIFIEDKNTSNS